MNEIIHLLVPEISFYHEIIANGDVKNINIDVLSVVFHLLSIVLRGMNYREF